MGEFSPLEGGQSLLYLVGAPSALYMAQKESSVACQGIVAMVSCPLLIHGQHQGNQRKPYLDYSTSDQLVYNPLNLPISIHHHIHHRINQTFCVSNASGGDWIISQDPLAFSH